MHITPSGSQDLVILIILNCLRLKACGSPLVQCVTVIKKLRLNFLAFLSKVAKKLRLPQAQAKELVDKLRLKLLPYDCSFLEPQSVL